MTSTQVQHQHLPTPIQPPLPQQQSLTTVGFGLMGLNGSDEKPMSASVNGELSTSSFHMTDAPHSRVRFSPTPSGLPSATLSMSHTHANQLDHEAITGESSISNWSSRVDPMVTNPHLLSNVSPTNWHHKPTWIHPHSSRPQVEGSGDCSLTKLSTLNPLLSRYESPAFLQEILRTTSEPQQQPIPLFNNPMIPTTLTTTTMTTRTLASTILSEAFLLNRNTASTEHHPSHSSSPLFHGTNPMATPLETTIMQQSDLMRLPDDSDSPGDFSLPNKSESEAAAADFGFDSTDNAGFNGSTQTEDTFIPMSFPRQLKSPGPQGHTDSHRLSRPVLLEHDLPSNKSLVNGTIPEMPRWSHHDAFGSRDASPRIGNMTPTKYDPFIALTRRSLPESVGQSCVPHVKHDGTGTPLISTSISQAPSSDCFRAIAGCPTSTRPCAMKPSFGGECYPFTHPFSSMNPALHRPLHGPPQPPPPPPPPQLHSPYTGLRHLHQSGLVHPSSGLIGGSHGGVGTGFSFGLDGTRRKNATRESTTTLKMWLQEHIKNPYPTKGEKIMLAIITKMTLTQVSTWFANARRRLKKENKMTWPPKTNNSNHSNNNNNNNTNNSSNESSQDQRKSASGDNTPIHTDAISLSSGKKTSDEDVYPRLSNEKNSSTVCTNRRFHGRNSDDLLGHGDDDQDDSEDQDGDIDDDDDDNDSDAEMSDLDEGDELTQNLPPTVVNHSAMHYLGELRSLCPQPLLFNGGRTSDCMQSLESTTRIQLDPERNNWHHNAYAQSHPDRNVHGSIKSSSHTPFHAPQMTPTAMIPCPTDTPARIPNPVNYMYQNAKYSAAYEQALHAKFPPYQTTFDPTAYIPHQFRTLSSNTETEQWPDQSQANYPHLYELKRPHPSDSSSFVRDVVSPQSPEVIYPPHSGHTSFDYVTAD